MQRSNILELKELPMRKISNPALFVVCTAIVIVTFLSSLQSNAALAQAPSQAPVQPASQPIPTEPSAKDSIVYVNTEYRFRFYLPKSWKGYSILVEKWAGSLVEKEGEDKPPQPETGPEIIIRHPLWTDGDPRQDIPIMIFTDAQWKLVQNDKLTVSAAPTGPDELARNAHYVFAVPPRYNYAFRTGYEEVDRILKRNSLRPF